MFFGTTRSRRHLVSGVLGGIALAAWTAEPPSAGPAEVPSRGELLYTTHCVECHNEQIHWRERKSARDWASLRSQVDHWQQVAHLVWTAEDIDAVTRYLNDTIYRFTPPHDEAHRAPAAPAPGPGAGHAD